ITMTGINAATATTVDGGPGIDADGAGTDRFAGSFTSGFNGSLTLANIESPTLSVTGTVTASSTITPLETPRGAGSGGLTTSTFGSVAGQVVAGSIINTTIGSIAQGGKVTAQGQGTTSDVSIGTLSGSFTAPEDGTPGSGVMSNTSIGTVTSTGTVSTGSISG